MLKDIVKLSFSSSASSELDLGDLDPSFDLVLARGDYHINFAGHDQNLVFENLKAKDVKCIDDLIEAMKASINEYEISGMQSLIFTFIGDAMDYVTEPIDYEFCIELK